MLEFKNHQKAILILVLLCLGAGIITVGCKQKKEPQIKNVLLLFADDMGAHLGVLGNPNVHTPTLDSLASKGMLFTEAHTSVASCSPSRSAILTGMYPHSNGHWRNTITPKITDPDSQFTRASTKLDKVGVHEEITTLIEQLENNGFYTGITQKWHLSPHWKFPFERRVTAKGSLSKIESDLNKFFAEVKDRPFFLQMNIGNTHRPYEHSIEYAQNVNPDHIKVPELFPDTPKARKDLAKYYTTVNGVDKVVHESLQALKRSGMAEETLVIFSSDHGWPNHRGKATAYYMGTHVPLIISGPGIPENKKNDALVSLIDIMPTILDYLDMETPETVQGRSLSPLLAGNTPGDWRSVLLTEHNSHGPPQSDWYPNRAVFDGRYHYIKNLWPDKTYRFPADLKQKEGWNNLLYSATMEAREEFPRPYKALQNTISRPKVELYDIQNDPYEMNNLADDPEYSSQVDRLEKQLQQWMEQTDDPFNPGEIPPRK